MRHSAQMALKQRYQTQALLNMGHPYQQIQVDGVHYSTISREVLRNQEQRGYSPQQAHGFTLCRQCTQVPRRIAANTWHQVNYLLQEEWSP